jgi:hypothetical protein
LLKDSFPCPIPNVEKDAHARPFLETDNTHGGTAFNHDRCRSGDDGTLSRIAVAQMTRFIAGRKELVNHAEPGPRYNEMEKPETLGFVRFALTNRPMPGHQARGTSRCGLRLFSI